MINLPGVTSVPLCHLCPSVSPQDWTHPPSHHSPPRWPWALRRRSQPRPQVGGWQSLMCGGKLCPLCPLVTQPGHPGVLPCMGDALGVKLPMAGSCQGAATVLVGTGADPPMPTCPHACPSSDRQQGPTLPGHRGGHHHAPDHRAGK